MGLKMTDKKTTKGPGMADVYDVAKKTIHQKTYADSPDDIVKNIIKKK